jgi:RNA polymerase sigma factor (sigma-70 family)
MKIPNKEITDLIKEYKITKSKILMEKIFILLDPMIKIKSKSVHYLIRKYKLEVEDVKQELCLKILQIINEFNPEKSFENYLFSCLRRWQPVLKKEDRTKYKSLYYINQTTGEEEEEKFTDNLGQKPTQNLIIEDIFKECKTDIEKQICKLYLEYPKISEAEIAEKLGTYQKDISRVINGLRKRLKKLV